MKKYMLAIGLLLLLCNNIYANQIIITESEGSACMGDDKSRKQTEQTALFDAKKNAVESISTSGNLNAEVKVFEVLEKTWYKDTTFGDCYRIRIKSEVIPNANLLERQPTREENKRAENNWVLWKKVTLYAGKGNSSGSKVIWDILDVVQSKAECEKIHKITLPYYKNTKREYYPDGTWGQTYYNFYCLPETIDPRDKN